MLIAFSWMLLAYALDKSGSFGTLGDSPIMHHVNGSHLEATRCRQIMVLRLREGSRLPTKSQEDLIGLTLLRIGSECAILICASMHTTYIGESI